MSQYKYNKDNSKYAKHPEHSMNVEILKTIWTIGRLCLKNETWIPENIHKFNME
jgi:hypothetical protein